MKMEGLSKMEIELENFSELFRFKGIAYIIVDGPKDVAVDTLAHVLAKSDHLLSGRKVRIEIYQVNILFFRMITLKNILETR